MGASRPRHQIEQALEVPVHCQGKVFHLPRFDFPSGVCAIGLQIRDFGSYLDRLAESPGLQLQVHANCAVHQHVHCSVDLLLKALLLDRHLVLPRRQFREHVISAFVRYNATRAPRVHFPDLDFSPGHYRTRDISDSSEQRCIDRLPLQPAASEHQQQPGY